MGGVTPSSWAWAFGSLLNTAVVVGLVLYIVKLEKGRWDRVDEKADREEVERELEMKASKEWVTKLESRLDDQLRGLRQDLNTYHAKLFEVLAALARSKGASMRNNDR